MSRRRGKGEGSIVERRPGQWLAVLTVGIDANGRRRRKYVYGTTKKAVQDKLLALRSDAARGLIVATDRMTIAEFLRRWLKDSAKLRLRPTSYDRFEWFVEKQILPRIGGVQLTALTPAHVQALYASMIRDKKSARACQHVHVILHSALNEALRWGLVSRNVCDAVRRPRHVSKPIQPLDKEQVQKFLKHTRGKRLEALMILALTTGLRQGELLALDWKDLDLAAGTVSVRKTLVEIKGEFSIGEPKTAQSNRQVRLPEIAVQVLKVHKEKMLAEGNISAPVFCDSDGGYIRKSNLLRRDFRGILKAAKLPMIRFHDLRHTFATLSIAEGVPIKVIQEALGHSSVTLTLGTYSHVLPSMQEEAVTKLNRLFGTLDSQDRLYLGCTKAPEGAPAKKRARRKSKEKQEVNDGGWGGGRTHDLRLMRPSEMGFHRWQ
ncbi:MAG: site-specific integrase [Deltaproteobacteria bacterium]|nr:site-specific integrase [Deltaproteobacteria bacterium]